MTSKPMAQMLANLRIDASHSRPRTPNDNPYSEAQFKTLEHCPIYPVGAGTFGQWHAWCREFFGWYTSTKQLADAAGTLKMQGNNLDEMYIERWVAALELAQWWTEAKRLAADAE